MNKQDLARLMEEAENVVDSRGVLADRDDLLKLIERLSRAIETIARALPSEEPVSKMPVELENAMQLIA